MTDITMCSGELHDGDCPLRERCYRYTAPANLYRQSYFGEPPYSPLFKECDYFWRDTLAHD